MGETEQPSAERDALLKSLASTPVPARVVAFPRRDLGGIPIAQCRIEVLSHFEHDEARKRVAERMMAADDTPERLGATVWEALYQDHVARELLARAITGCKPMDGTGGLVFPRLFLSGAEIGDLLTPAETQALLDLYVEAQASAYPNRDDEAPDDGADVDDPPEEP